MEISSRLIDAFIVFILHIFCVYFVEIFNHLIYCWILNANYFQIFTRVNVESTLTRLEHKVQISFTTREIFWLIFFVGHKKTWINWISISPWPWYRLTLKSQLELCNNRSRLKFCYIFLSSLTSLLTSYFSLQLRQERHSLALTAALVHSTILYHFVLSREEITNSHSTAYSFNEFSFTRSKFFNLTFWIIRIYSRLDEQRVFYDQFNFVIQRDRTEKFH